MSEPIKPTPPVLGTKYLGIGRGYVTSIDDAVKGATGELGNRIDIVPYTSMGDRDVLGLNAIECLGSLQGLLASAQANYEGYEETCKKEDQAKYEEEYAKYQAALAQYEKDMEEYEKGLEDSK